MSLEIEFVEKECRLNANITCKNITSESEIAKTFDEMDEALGVFANRLREDKIYFFGINIRCKRPFLSRLLPVFNGREAKKYVRSANEEFSQAWAHYPNNSFNPWEAMCPDFWLAALTKEALHPRIKEWITKLENLLIAANQSNRSTASLWEHDEIQFGEPLVTLLALHDKEFVPCYSSLMRHWDMGHEVNQINEIEQIVRKYGICKETEELLFHRVSDRDAQWHIDQIETLLPFLLEQDDNFFSSEMFALLVFGLHQSDLKWRTEEFNEYRNKIEVFNKRDNPKPSDVKPRAPNLVKRYNFFEYSDNDQLKSATDIILSKLIVEYPEPDFAAL